MMMDKVGVFRTEELLTSAIAEAARAARSAGAE